MKIKILKIFCLVVFSLIGTLTLLPPGLMTSSASENNESFKKLLDRHEKVAAHAAQTYQLSTIAAGRIYSLSVSLSHPASLSERDSLAATLIDDRGMIARKILHPGDPDLYALFRSTTGGAGKVEIVSAAQVPVDYSVTVLQWPTGKVTQTSVESEPNDSWSDANEIMLGTTVWSTADDKPYIVPLTEDNGGTIASQHVAEQRPTDISLPQSSQAQPKNRGTAAYEQSPVTTEKSNVDRLPDGGIDWFKFTYEGDTPKLIYFDVNLLERDNIPVDVSIFRVENGEPKNYEVGSDPVSPPHEVQALPGNKFTTRVITRGTYYVRVNANHAFYQLRTTAYDPPPYDDPHRAVQTAMDYIISAGDSWHANTPRHGGIVNRVASVHAETTTCIACHATHFSARAELIAKKNGYPVKQRAQLQFLTERLYNNPRPFYGHPDATWARVISAAANVMSRLSSLLEMYETEVSGERRLSLLKGVGGYLKIYYKGRTVLPADESNGNTPLVSTYEVAFYSWKVFDELAKQTGEEEYRAYRDLVRSLIEQDKHKNLVDLCYQTIALATIDRTAYAEKIKRNAERILSLQRPDGQWSMLFEPDSPAVEFQTGHCLYTLALAGFSADHPQVAKGLKFLQQRQQAFGGWFDPKQSYENFRTPFRETQFAIMALSEFYKGKEGRGWNAGFAPLPERLAERDPLLQLEQMDSVWDQPGKRLTGDLIHQLESAEPMLRMAAATALGRAVATEALGSLSKALGDRHKMVQLAAAWAIRQITTRRQVGYDQIQTALRHKDERARWGATRIFAQHFAYLVNRREPADQLIGLLNDPYVAVRMQAAKSLSQWFYWTRDDSLRGRIVDALMARMAEREHPWVRRNLLENFYSIADENVRYLYDNWIALIAQKEDRERAIKAHHETSRDMAERIARALKTGNDLQREGLLRAITEFHLREGGYASGGRYTRIGNDIETIRFYEEGAPALEKALVPLVNSTEATTRKQAILAAYTLRDDSLLSLPLLVMRRLIDPDPSVRSAADEFYKSLPLKVEERNRREAVMALKALLASGRAEAQIAALDRVKDLGRDFAQQENFDAEVRNFVISADLKVAPAAIRAVADFPNLEHDAVVQQRIVKALQSSDQNLLRSAVQLVLARATLREQRPIAVALDSLLQTTDPSKRQLILGQFSANTDAQSDLRLQNLVVESLSDANEQVRAAALGVVRRVKSLQTNQAIRAALAKLMKDPNQRLQGQAIALYQGQDGGNVAIEVDDVNKALDYEFFAKRVMPLLATKGRDGNACVNCHFTHNIFRLNMPDASGRFTDTQVRENYRSALKVVDLANPENSLILRKPISSSEQEGVVGAKKLPHGGGQRWTGTDDPAYRTVLEWINGARFTRSTK